MTTPLTQIQIDAINRMSAEQRYGYFIDHALEQGQLWGLASAAGWLILPDGDEEQLPVWPHEALAAQWATGEFGDCTPKAVALAEWLERWLPGMAADGLLVAVCPGISGEAIVVAADELLEEMTAEKRVEPDSE